MTAGKQLSRDTIYQVCAADGTTWLGIDGINKGTVNPGSNSANADITTFSSAGQYEQLMMQRGASISLEGFRVTDLTTGVQDAGQARCETLATAVGYASQGKFRFRDPLDTVWKVWTATFEIGEQGGGNNDPKSWKVDVTRSGASTTMAAP
jgi:hypothetical protein